MVEALLNAGVDFNSSCVPHYLAIKHDADAVHFLGDYARSHNINVDWNLEVAEGKDESELITPLGLAGNLYIKLSSALTSEAKEEIEERANQECASFIKALVEEGAVVKEGDGALIALESAGDVDSIKYILNFKYEERLKQDIEQGNSVD